MSVSLADIAAIVADLAIGKPVDVAVGAAVRTGVAVKPMKYLAISACPPIAFDPFASVEPSVSNLVEVLFSGALWNAAPSSETIVASMIVLVHGYLLEFFQRV